MKKQLGDAPELDRFIEKFHPKYGGVLYKASVPHVGTDFYQTLEAARKFVQNSLEWLKAAEHMRRLEDISYGPRKNPSVKTGYENDATEDIQHDLALTMADGGTDPEAVRELKRRGAKLPSHVRRVHGPYRRREGSVEFDIENPPGQVDYITPAAAKKLAGPMFPKLRQGFMAVGTHAGHSFRAGYVIPKGYYVEWDITDAGGSPETFGSSPARLHRGIGETDEEINARLAELSRLAGMPAALENPSRLTIRAGSYRGQEGFKIFGTDARGRRVRIFTRTYISAVNILNKLRRDEEIGSADFQPNPRGTKIYNRIISIRATKAGMPHHCDDECRKHGHRYEHKFKEKASVVGLENGNVLLKSD